MVRAAAAAAAAASPAAADPTAAATSPTTQRRGRVTALGVDRRGGASAPAKLGEAGGTAEACAVEPGTDRGIQLSLGVVRTAAAADAALATTRRRR